MAVGNAPDPTVISTRPDVYCLMFMGSRPGVRAKALFIYLTIN